MKLALLSLLLAPAVAAAHDLGVQAKLKSGRIHVEAYFDDNTPARAAKVVVTDAGNRLIAEGRTDSEGRWSFAAPPPGSYSITVDAGDGHKIMTDITIPGGQADAVVSEGPPRDEFTRPRWLGLGIGVGVIVALVIVSRVYLRSKFPPTV